MRCAEYTSMGKTYRKPKSEPKRVIPSSLMLNAVPLIAGPNLSGVCDVMLFKLGDF
jgi:hypothetical protein